MAATGRWLELGIILALTGFGLAFIGFLVILFSLLAGTKPVSGGVVVFIGPFPIALGFGPEAPALLAVAFLVGAVMMLALLLSVRPWRRAEAPAKL